METDWLALSSVLFQRDVHFWFATGGAGFCLSRKLAEKMAPWARWGLIQCVFDWFWGHFMHMLVLVPWSQKVPQLFLQDSNKSKLRVYVLIACLYFQWSQVWADLRCDHVTWWLYGGLYSWEASGNLNGPQQHVPLSSGKPTTSRP